MVILTGAVAQLGARLHGMEEVEGSNPFGSTTLLLRKLPSSHRTAGIELASCQWVPLDRWRVPLRFAGSYRVLQLSFLLPSLADSGKQTALKRRLTTCQMLQSCCTGSA